MARSPLDRLVAQRIKGTGPPAGPAGPVALTLGQWAAAHDRPPIRPQFDSGVPRMRPRMKVRPRRNRLS